MELPQKSNSLIDFVCVARQTSTRFPNKIFADISGRSLLSIIIEKLNMTGAGIIFAIPDNHENDQLFNYLVDQEILVVRGSETNVLDRFCQASMKSKAQYIQRFNCDNLLFDPNYVIKVHDIVKKNKDYNIFSNTHCINHSGQSVEIVRKDLCLSLEVSSPYEQEHIFPYFYRKYEDKFLLPCPSQNAFPIDVPSDLKRVISGDF